MPDNRRNVCVFLTPRGRALERKLVPLAEDVNRIALTRVTRADLAVTRQTLLAILDNLARDEQRGHAAPRVKNLHAGRAPARAADECARGVCCTNRRARTGAGLAHAIARSIVNREERPWV